MAAFYTDNDVALSAVDLLAAAGHAAVGARDLRFEHASDDEQLLVASQQRRILVTHNERDFILLHDAWQRWSSAWGIRIPHAGILILPQGTRYGVFVMGCRADHPDDPRLPRAVSTYRQRDLALEGRALATEAREGLDPMHVEKLRSPLHKRLSTR